MSRSVWASLAENSKSSNYRRFKQENCIAYTLLCNSWKRSLNRLSHAVTYKFLAINTRNKKGSHMPAAWTHVTLDTDTKASLDYVGGRCNLTVLRQLLDCPQSAYVRLRVLTRLSEHRKWNQRLSKQHEYCSFRPCNPLFVSEDRSL